MRILKRLFRLRSGVFLGLLVTSVVHGGPDDHGNNAPSATLVSVPSSTPGNIEEGTDTDWFRFSAVAGGDYQFDTVLGTLPDSKLRLINTDGVTLIQENDDFGGTLASRITWTAPSNGTYYLEVIPFSITQTGTYSLDTQGPPPDDHGNNAPSATLVSVPSSTPGNIEPGTDTDWFRFSAVAGGDYQFETVLGTLPDSKLRLINTDGVTLIQENDDFGGTLASRITWMAPSNGTYYLEVIPFSTAQTGTYALVTRGPIIFKDGFETP